MKSPDKQWDSVWVNCHLATMAGGLGVIENAALAISGGRIGWVGKKSELPGTAATRHDARGAWLTPGLVDCHTHLVYAGSRAREFVMRMEGKSYADIAKAGGGILATVQATRAASEAELLAASDKRFRALIREGVTTVEIKSGYGLDLENELKMLRVARRLGQMHSVTVRTTFLGAHAVPPEYAGKADAYIDYLCAEVLPAIAREKLADAVDGFCETIGFTREQISKLFEAAKQFHLPLKLHAEQLSDQGGAKLAAAAGALSADHLEHADEAGIKAMAKAGTVAVLLPGAYYMLRETQKPPVELLRKHGVRMAVSTDCNPGTSPIASLLTIMNMGCVLFHLTPEEALRGATAHAAAALGMGEEIGTLEEGKIADIAMWDVSHPSELTSTIGYNPLIGIIKQGRYEH